MLLEQTETYKAALHDFDTAAARANKAVATGAVPEAKREEFFLRELTHLVEQRIERGEIPPFEVEPIR